MVVVDLDSSESIEGLVYVSLSRARKLAILMVEPTS